MGFTRRMRFADGRLRPQRDLRSHGTAERFHRKGRSLQLLAGKSRSPCSREPERRKVSSAKKNQTLDPCAPLSASAELFLNNALRLIFRYDVRKSMMANMNLPAALLSRWVLSAKFFESASRRDSALASAAALFEGAVRPVVGIENRFDLQFLMLDKADAEQDAQMAAHILGVYQGGGGQAATAPFHQNEQGARGRRSRRAPRRQTQQAPKFVDKKVLRAFIEKAKSITPVLPESVLSASAARIHEFQGSAFLLFPNFKALGSQVSRAANCGLVCIHAF